MVVVAFLMTGATPGKANARQTASNGVHVNPTGVTEPGAGNDLPRSFAATAADHVPDQPRRRDELGQALPFRERVLSASSVDILRTANTGNFATLELFPDISFKVRVTGRWDDGDGSRVAARLEGRPERDRLFASWNGDSMRTLIELPSENLAYELIGDGSGEYLVREWLFTDVVCATPSPDNRGAEAGIPRPAGGQISSGAAVAPAAVPLLNSRPGAVAVIYLDFDGEVVSGTSWSSGATINAPAARLNSSQITEVHERVKRDFEIFDVNVTTDRALHDAAPLNRRTHCIVTGNDQPAPGAGGVAYLNSFTENFSSRKICWAFLDTNAKDTAEVVSHEVGHTLDLDHDGRLASGGLPRDEYYEGHGSGATGWAPIMGVGYYRQLTQWSKGEYARANNTEDDIAIISQATRIPVLADDHGGTRGNASNVTGDRVQGYSEIRSDLDYFRVELPAGAHSIFLQPAGYGNNDLELQVQDAGGIVIATANPVDELAATATFNLASAQTVYLRVDSTGKGDPLTTGYTDYGSLGLYYLYGFGNQQLPPSAPIGITTARISGTQARISWTPNPSATSYRVFRNGVLLATVYAAEYVDASARPSTEYSYAVTAVNAYGEGPASAPSSFVTPAFDEFVMDGAPDFAGYLLSNPGMTIYAALRGTMLYVATWSPGNSYSGFGSDHHLFVSDSLLGSPSAAAPWGKAGTVSVPANKPYLAGEYESNYAGWFNTTGGTALFKSPVNSGAMEGVIDLVAEFGNLPQYVYVAAVAYNNPDGGGINSQAPAGNGNNNLEPGEFLRIPVRSARDAAQSGTYDILDAARSFAVTNVSLNASNRPVLRWPVVPGNKYMVQGRGELVSGTWTNLLNSNWAAGATQWEMEFTDMAAPTGARYYRVTRP